MRIATSLSMAALLCLSSTAIGQERQPEDSPTAVAKADRVYAMVYKISDLPVWSEDGEEFDATVLVALIKATVASDTWGKTSTINGYSQTRSLVVSATNSTHGELAKLLERLRATPKSKQEGTAAAVGDQATDARTATTAFTYYGTRGVVVAADGRRGRLMLGTPLPANFEK